MNTKIIVVVLAGLLGICSDVLSQEPNTELRVPIPQNAAVTFGPPGCPFVLVGKDVWHLKQGQIVHTFDGDYESHALRSLNANGHYFAVGSKSRNLTDTSVTVWNISKNISVLTIPGDKQKFVDVLTFAGQKTLVLGGRNSAELSIWDIESGKELRTVTIPVRNVSYENLDVSPDGKYFAVAGDDNIVVCSLANGKQVGALAVPGDSPVGTQPVLDEKLARFQSALKKQLEAHFTSAWIRGLKFSPNGKEIAAVSTYPHAHLICWSSQGKLLLDEPLLGAKLSVSSLTLKWLPDGSGWLVNGNLFDRASKQLVLTWRKPFAREAVMQPLDRDRIFGQFGDRSVLQTFVVPWKQLNVSLVQMKRKAAAYLGPGQPISVKIDISNAPGDVHEMEQLMREAVVKRLGRIGIPVKVGQPTTLVLRLAGREDDRQPIIERQLSSDVQGRDAGRRVAEAGGDLVIELVAVGKEEVIWRDRLSETSDRQFREGINDQAMRKKTVEIISRQLTDFPLPYFVPKSVEILALPAVMQ